MIPPRIVIHKVHRHHWGHVDFPYLCSSSPSDRSMLSGNVLLKFHSTGSRAITQHDVTRALDQCTVVCKRSPLQLAQLSLAIDSQYWQSPQSMAADCGCLPLSLLSRRTWERFFYSILRIATCRSRFYNDCARLRNSREKKREGRTDEPINIL